MKKRLLLLLGTLVLSACGKPTPLPHEEVVQRAAFASQKLQSATFAVDLDGTYAHLTSKEEDMDILLSADGAFMDGGGSLSSDFDATFAWTDNQTSANAYMRGMMSVRGPQTYLLFSDVGKTPSNILSPFDGFEELIGMWVALPSDAAKSDNGASLSPDPSVLQAQAALVRVTKDFGLEKRGDGYAYHYGVELDREKFSALMQADDTGMEASGEMWIDAQSFYLLEARWSVSALPLLEGMVDADIVVMLHNHDVQVDVAGPTDDAVPLDPLFFHSPPEEASLFEGLDLQASGTSGTL